jgi:aminopeptidase
LGSARPTHDRYGIVQVQEGCLPKRTLVDFSLPIVTFKAMLDMLHFDERLDRLAELSVRVGLGLQPGQEIILTAPLEAASLVRRITEHAYKVGANLVTPVYSDSIDQLARFQYAPDSSFDVAPVWLADSMAAAYQSKNVLRLSIVGENPSLLQGQDPERVSRLNRARSKAFREVLDLLSTFTVNWSVVAFATPAWANAVFPELPEREAVDQLWNAIFAASRVNVPNPVAAWQAHNRSLHARASFLNRRRYHALHFRSLATDLRVGLADDHLWLGGATQTGDRPSCTPNIPTEEVFTTPHRERVEGTVVSTKPLYFLGTLIEDIRVRFVQGRAVEAVARVGNDILQRVLETDDGAARLGEVALVPHSSPISRTGLLFQNTLFDENAASHVAFGQAYGDAISGSDDLEPAALAARGTNSSQIHIDWMIGSDEIDVDGIAVDGTVEPVMRSGEWATSV